MQNAEFVCWSMSAERPDRAGRLIRYGNFEGLNLKVPVEAAPADVLSHLEVYPGARVVLDTVVQCYQDGRSSHTVKSLRLAAVPSAPSSSGGSHK